MTYHPTDHQAAIARADAIAQPAPTATDLLSIIHSLERNEARAFGQWRAAALNPPATNALNHQWFLAHCEISPYAVYSPHRNHAADYFRAAYYAEADFWKAQLGTSFYGEIDRIYRPIERLKEIRSIGLLMLH